MKDLPLRENRLINTIFTINTGYHLLSVFLVPGPLETFHVHFPFWLYSAGQKGIIIFLILHMWKPRHRDAKEAAQGPRSGQFGSGMSAWGFQPFFLPPQCSSFYTSMQPPVDLLVLCARTFPSVHNLFFRCKVKTNPCLVAALSPTGLSLDRLGGRVSMCNSQPVTSRWTWFLILGPRRVKIA